MSSKPKKAKKAAKVVVKRPTSPEAAAKTFGMSRRQVKKVSKMVDKVLDGR